MSHDPIDPNCPSTQALLARREWIGRCLLAGGTVATLAHADALAATLVQQDPVPSAVQEPTYTAEKIRNAAWMSRVPLTDEQCERIAKDLTSKDRSIQALRTTPIEENTPMASVFSPWFFAPALPSKPAEDGAGEEMQVTAEGGLDSLSQAAVPDFDGIESAAFWTIRQLAAGLRQKLFTSQQLTAMYLERLKRYDPLLHCVVSFNEGAMAEAKKADDELATGQDRGWLHGIPWGAKDIIAIPGMPTTWGAVDYQDRERGPIATVAYKMQEAGAVLLAKLSVGTLAWGDKWFRAMTRNPWDPTKGSSGSSAGSASAAVAGLCGFAIGSETLGSIVSPCRVCSATGLRPTFGRVSRFGCMTLGWTMDKIGPIARSVDDCGVVFEAMLGPDGRDPTVVERPYAWPVPDWSVRGLRVGVPAQQRGNGQRIAELFAEHGAEIVELTLEPDPRIAAMSDAITIEAAAMHGALFEQASADSQVGEWGPVFREAQFCSAIDYVQSMRARVSLIEATEAKLRTVDILIGDGDLTRMNLTGHPSLVVAFGQQPEREQPRTVVLTAKFFHEAGLLAAGAWMQSQQPATPSAPKLEMPPATDG